MIIYPTVVTPKRMFSFGCLFVCWFVCLFVCLFFCCFHTLRNDKYVGEDWVAIKAVLCLMLHFGSAWRDCPDSACWHGTKTSCIHYTPLTSMEDHMKSQHCQKRNQFFKARISRFLPIVLKGVPLEDRTTSSQQNHGFPSWTADETMHGVDVPSVRGFLLRNLGGDFRCFVFSPSLGKIA